MEHTIVGDYDQNSLKNKVKIVKGVRLSDLYVREAKNKSQRATEL